MLAGTRVFKSVDTFKEDRAKPQDGSKRDPSDNFDKPLHSDTSSCVVFTVAAVRRAITTLVLKWIFVGLFAASVFFKVVNWLAGKAGVEFVSICFMPEFQQNLFFQARSATLRNTK